MLLLQLFNSDARRLTSAAPQGASTVSTLSRRTAVAAFSAGVLFTAPPAQAFTDPLTKLAEATKARRFREAAAQAVSNEEPEAESAATPALQTLASPDANSAADASSGDDVLATPAGLAKLDAELNAAYELAEEMNFAQLRIILRSSLFSSFLGFVPGYPALERQVQLLGTFPKQSRREAAETLGKLNNMLSALDESLADIPSLAATVATTVPTTTLTTVGRITTAISDARAVSQQITTLYLADGCQVCPDQIKASKQDEGFDNPNLRKLKEFEPRLLRRPDERNEVVARQLGFREGELIGGY